MFSLLKNKFKQIAEKISKKSKEKEISKPEREEKTVIQKLKIKIEKRLTEKDLEPILEDMEVELLESDVALEVVEKIRSDLLNQLVGREIKKKKWEEIVRESLKKSLEEILQTSKLNLVKLIEDIKNEGRPALILFFGVNGVGKSLTLAKLANWLRKKGLKPLLAAGDTFRAAGIEQLEEYADSIKIPLIKQKRGADSCAVIFDARQAAKARKYDVVLADTSGRMHTKKDLMEELRKIVRVNKPDLKVLILDSLAGSDVLTQFEFFDKAVGIDAVIFTKVDINEKGGNILSVCYKYRKPVLFLGTGQRIEDFEEFDPKRLIRILLS